jgi:hypothetical protein
VRRLKRLNKILATKVPGPRPGRPTRSECMFSKNHRPNSSVPTAVQTNIGGWPGAPYWYGTGARIWMWQETFEGARTGAPSTNCGCFWAQSPAEAVISCNLSGSAAGAEAEVSEMVVAKSPR